MSTVKKICICSFCTALCCVLPLACHAAALGSVLSPMHLPVLLCGLLCGWPYGLFCGAAGPLLSFLLVGSPPAISLLSMIPELCVYGAASALLFRLIRTGRTGIDLYCALIPAMLLGRGVGGAVTALVYLAGAQEYTLALWAGSYFVATLPGALLQLLLLPALYLVLVRSGSIPPRYPAAPVRICPMDETKAVLSAHAARYPHMTVQDAVKLLYQNEFGPGHLVQDPAAARVRLEQEWCAVEHDPTAPPFENIGNGLVRVNLAAWDFQQYPLESLADDFIRSAASHQGSTDRFLKKIDLLRDLTKQGVFSFSPEDLEEYLEDYINRGCPMVSHSDMYRGEYLPAYRVVRRDRLSLPALTVILKEIAFRQKSDCPLLIAIDGRCASGKTTLAARLQQELGCPVIHMDDFFLRPKQRTSQRYATPGGNVDHERFLKEVLRPLHRGKAIRYHPFSCSTQTLGDPIRVTPAPVVVVEGSYSCHPALRGYYHLRLFLNISPEEQEKRIIRRDGEEYARVFREKWIPLEEAYFSACMVEKCCQFSFEIESDCGEAWDS